MAALLLVPTTLIPSVPAKESMRPKLGILVVDHGEPPEYNELTYYSFRRFFEHLIEMGLIPSWVTAIDTGTIVQDSECYACDEPSTGGTYLDAWLTPHQGPAAYLPSSDNTPAHHVIPGGPGLGEPDFFEHIGLAAWNEWELMGGRSPNYAQKLAKKKAVFAALRGRYGEGLPIRVGYGIDPRIDGTYRGVRKAVRKLIEVDGADRLVVTYHGVGFSDIMQTHHVRHEVEAAIEATDPDVELTYAAPIGKSPQYVASVVNEARAELNLAPNGDKVAIHLSGHGLSPEMCGDYDCGADAYHRYAADLFQRTSRALRARIDRPFKVFHIYGDGGEGDDDPNDEVVSPLEGLAARKKQGFDRVIDIPYEFDSDSRDTLIVLRKSYQRPIPDWDADYESRFRYEGMNVKIDNSSFGKARKAKAFYDVIAEAIENGRFHPVGHH